MDRRRKDTKEKFVKFALDKIRMKGEEEVTLRDLSTEYGISAAALYNHFIDKDELYQEILLAGANKLNTLYREYISEQPEPASAKDALIQMGEFISKLTLKENNLIRFVFFSDAAISLYTQEDVFSDSRFKLLSAACELIDKVKFECDLKASNYDLYVKFWSFIEGYCILVSSGVLDGNEHFVRDVVEDVIAGDRFRQKKGSK